MLDVEWKFPFLENIHQLYDDKNHNHCNYVVQYSMNFDSSFLAEFIPAPPTLTQMYFIFLSTAFFVVSVILWHDLETSATYVHATRYSHDKTSLILNIITITSLL